MPQQRVLFLTGKLAEPALRRVVAALNEQKNLQGTVQALGISVAALMHVDWLRRQLSPGEVAGYDRVLLPGRSQGDVAILTQHFGIPFEKGPQELHELPEYLGGERPQPVPLDRYDIEILAEINHAPRRSDEEILRIAHHYRHSGADLIDLGCLPGETWDRIGDVTRRLCTEGFRVSVDSFERAEVEAAVAAGAELVLSCNAANRDWAVQTGAECVLIPDESQNLDTLAETVQLFSEHNRPFRIDPVLEPIGFGLAASLFRYFAARQRWPEAEMMMGVGNLTELTEADTAGMNMLLAGICQELHIRSVLTTEVINWARSAVREFDIARRQVFHAVQHGVLPKHLDDRLVMLRDPRLHRRSPEEITELAERITDPNFRILVEGDEIHVINRDGHWRGTDPYELFDRFAQSGRPLDSPHAFYLGYELCKARTALTLGKNYVQDEALRWGWLTVPEVSAHERRRRERRETGPASRLLPPEEPRPEKQLPAEPPDNAAPGFSADQTDSGETESDATDNSTTNLP